MNSIAVHSRYAAVLVGSKHKSQIDKIYLSLLPSVKMDSSKCTEFERADLKCIGKIVFCIWKEGMREEIAF